jgi:hypothetical protein
MDFLTGPLPLPPISEDTCTLTFWASHAIGACRADLTLESPGEDCKFCLMAYLSAYQATCATFYQMSWQMFDSGRPPA